MRNHYASLTAPTTADYQPGNRLDLLQNGEEIFPAMLAAIRGATHTIEFATYVYWRSQIASEFAAALCERARAGVEVRLLVDAVGAAIMSTRTVWQLERAGVRVAWFRPVHWPHVLRINHRTHRKILLVDDRLGFTGGVGIADEWTGAAQDRQHWRDTHCRLAGPALAGLLAGFAENWQESTGEHLRRTISPEPAGDTAVLATASTATQRPTAMQQLFLAGIAAARRRLWITTAYLVPSPELIAALVAAARRGVDVRILTNGPATNHKVTRRAGHATYEQLLTAGVKVFEYQPTVLHSKVMTADQSWATLGSANLDDRSLVLNDELNLSFTEPRLVEALDQQFLADLERATAIEPAIWLQRPGWDRLAEAGASVFRHQL